MIVRGFCFRIERITPDRDAAEPVVEITSQQLLEMFEADGRPHLGWEIPGPRDFPLHRVSFVPGEMPALPHERRKMNAALAIVAALCGASFLAGFFLGA